MNKLSKRQFLYAGVITLVGFLVLVSSIVINPGHHYLNSLILIIAAVALYFCIVFLLTDRNWLDIRAVFTGMWLGTIGLAALRLTDYQEPWQAKTWLMVALAYLMFQIGANIGIHVGGGLYSKAHKKLTEARFGKVRFQMQPNRLFAICVVTTLIGLLCFIINIKIRGFLPYFSDDDNAYTLFYTKFHIFAVAATGVSGLCYYCIKTQPIGIFKKIILGICIFYLVFAFPVLVVSRGVFVVAALSLTVAVFYLNRKKLTALILCLAVIMGVYMFASNLRNYTDDQMLIFFEPAEITLSEEEQTLPPDTTEEVVAEEEVVADENAQVLNPDALTFSLSPKMAFLYSYITVSHDNFNLAVKNLQEYTWGLRELAPFNVILRSQAIEGVLSEAEFYQVNPYLNTANLIGDFYYDLGAVGVALFMLLWSAIFGIMQASYETGKGPFALIVLGNAMAPVTLCFFACWLSNFTQWMLWGVALLASIAACVKIEKQ